MSPALEQDDGFVRFDECLAAKNNVRFRSFDF